MISLNDVTLSTDLIWTGEFDNPVISQNTQRTILGKIVVQTMPLLKGKLIKLEARYDGQGYSGYFTRTQIIEFKRLEETGESMVFHYEGSEYTVVFSAGGVQVTPIIPRPNQQASDLYTGTVILIEV